MARATNRLNGSMSLLLLRSTIRDMTYGTSDAKKSQAYQVLCSLIGAKYILNLNKKYQHTDKPSQIALIESVLRGDFPFRATLYVSESGNTATVPMQTRMKCVPIHQGWHIVPATTWLRNEGSHGENLRLSKTSKRRRTFGVAIEEGIKSVYDSWRSY